MKVCDYCGRTLDKWNIDERRMIMCDYCVQRLLGYTPFIPTEHPKLAPKQRTGAKEGIGMGKLWDRKKSPIKWEDLL